MLLAFLRSSPERLRGALFGVALTSLGASACGTSGTVAPTGASSTSAGGASSSVSSSSSAASVASTATSGPGGGGSGGAGGGPLTVSGCFADDFVKPPSFGPNYDQFSPIVGSHCQGTNHQDITGVERVVFLGDSVTVGTPPTFSEDFYRAKLADALAAKFKLAPANLVWKSANLFDGTAIVKESGDFASCSKWGARTDDLLPKQLPDCFGASTLSKKTLVVMTMGGNDIHALTKKAIANGTDEELWQLTKDFVKRQREALDWLQAPGRFPQGVYVVFANMYEFTDGTGKVESCNVSGLAGFDKPVPAPAKLAEMVVWANEQFIKMAVETKTDVIFLLETFCGHGFQANNPDGPCYRGPGSEVWFDLTCIHPTPKGHAKISELFYSVIDE